jgi:hypothetical protein
MRGVRRPPSIGLVSGAGRHPHRDIHQSNQGTAPNSSRTRKQEPVITLGPVGLITRISPCILPVLPAHRAGVDAYSSTYG